MERKFSTGSFNFHVNMILLEFIEERCMRDSKFFGGLSFTVGMFEGFHKDLSFVSVKQGSKRLRIGYTKIVLSVCYFFILSDLKTEENAFHVNLLAFAKNGRSLDDISQFADIARPGV